jgi:hypothetical protein
MGLVAVLKREWGANYAAIGRYRAVGTQTLPMVVKLNGLDRMVPRSGAERSTYCKYAQPIENNTNYICWKLT